MKTSTRRLSLDEQFGNEKGNSFLEVLEDTKEMPPDHFIMEESLKHDINLTLASLDPREARIIQLSFGLIGERALTLEEIGGYFGLTRERIRQIKEKALRRMRHHTRSAHLKKYLG